MMFGRLLSLDGKRLDKTGGTVEDTRELTLCLNTLQMSAKIAATATK